MNNETQILEIEKNAQINTAVDHNIISELEFERRKALRYAELNNKFGSPELAHQHEIIAEKFDRMIHYIKTGEVIKDPEEN